MEQSMQHLALTTWNCMQSLSSSNFCSLAVVEHHLLSSRFFAARFPHLLQALLHVWHWRPSIVDRARSRRRLGNKKLEYKGNLFVVLKFAAKTRGGGGKEYQIDLRTCSRSEYFLPVARSRNHKLKGTTKKPTPAA